MAYGDIMLGPNQSICVHDGKIVLEGMSGGYIDGIPLPDWLSITDPVRGGVTCWTKTFKFRSDDEIGYVLTEEVDHGETYLPTTNEYGARPSPLFTDLTYWALPEGEYATSRSNSDEGVSDDVCDFDHFEFEDIVHMVNWDITFGPRSRRSVPVVVGFRELRYSAATPNSNQKLVMDPVFKYYSNTLIGKRSDYEAQTYEVDVCIAEIVWNLNFTRSNRTCPWCYLESVGYGANNTFDNKLSLRYKYDTHHTFAYNNYPFLFHMYPDESYFTTDFPEWAICAPAFIPGVGFSTKVSGGQRIDVNVAVPVTRTTQYYDCTKLYGKIRFPSITF